MIDLFISYINFIILSISYIIKKFTFHPPDPPRYRIKKNNSKEDIYFSFKIKQNTPEYQKVGDKRLDVKFKKLIFHNILVPILKITPNSYNSQKPKCIIYCQGNNGDLGTSYFECKEISIKSGCIIVTFEYPGYGYCKDENFSEEEIYKRIKIVYLYLVKYLKFKPHEIILYGFSLGTGVAFDLACNKDYPVAGLILIAPYLSIFRTLYNVKRTFYFDLFSNIDKANELKTKTLFVHGNCDEIIPYIHGRILSKLIPEQYLYDFLTVCKGNHNSILIRNLDKIMEYINKFIDNCISNYDSNSNIDNNEESCETIGKDNEKTKSLNIFIDKGNKVLDKKNNNEEIFISKSYLNYSTSNTLNKSISPNEFLNPKKIDRGNEYYFINIDDNSIENPKQKYNIKNILSTNEYITMNSSTTNINKINNTNENE